MVLLCVVFLKLILNKGCGLEDINSLSEVGYHGVQTFRGAFNWCYSSLLLKKSFVRKNEMYHHHHLALQPFV